MKYENFFKTASESKKVVIRSPHGSDVPGTCQHGVAISEMIQCPHCDSPKDRRIELD